MFDIFDILRVYIKMAFLQELVSLSFVRTCYIQLQQGVLTDVQLGFLNIVGVIIVGI